MIDKLNIKPILEPINRVAKDPIRFPKVINGYENKSKKDFHESLKIEVGMIIKELSNDSS